MQKLFAFFLAMLALASCSVSELSSNLSNSTFSNASTPVDGDTVTVNYVGTFDDGEVFDSSRTDDRQPLQFVIGSQSMIPGFENAVKTLKVGEKKNFHIEPKDAYGEEYVESTLPLSEYKESYVQQNIPENVLLGVMEQSVPLEQAKQIFGTQEVRVWDEKSLGNAQVSITKIDTDNVTVSINDPQAPFYGKTLEAWLTATIQDGTVVKVISIDENGASVEIKPNYEVISQTDTDITLRTKNTHRLAGKPLNFEIELVSIEKPASAQTAEN